MTGCLSPLSRRLPITRAVASVPPPAPQGTMSWTGRCGYCASAPKDITSNAAGSSRFIDLVTTILTMGPGVKSGRLWRQSMNAPAQAAKVSAHLAALSLKDPKLFREQCYIGGDWRGGANAIPVRNPATQSVIGTVPKLGAEEARRAIDAAERAW